MPEVGMLPQNTHQGDGFLSLPPDISYTLDEAVFSSRALPEVLTLVLDTVLDLLKAQDGSLRWVDYRHNKLVLKARRLASGDNRISKYDQDLDLNCPSIMAHVVKEKKPILISDLRAENWQQRYVRLDPSTEMLSELAVPLFSSDGKAVVGVLNVESPQPGAFSSQHQDWLLALGRRAQMVVQRTQLAEALQTLARKVLELDPDALLTYTVEALADLLHVPVCSIWLLDHTSGDLVLKQATGRTQEPQDTRLEANHFRQSFLGEALKSPKPVYLSNVQVAKKFLYKKLARNEGWVSTLAVPIRTAAGKAVGVTSVYSVEEERRFNEHDRNLAIAFSDHVAIALQQASLLEEKKQSAQQLDVSNKRLQMVNEIHTASVLASDSDSFLKQVATLINQAFHYRTDICLLEQGQLVFKATVLYDGTAKNNVMVFPLTQGISGAVASSGRYEIVPDVTQDSRYYCSSPETLSEMAVPLTSQQGHVIGVLDVESQQRNAFSQDHIRIFQGIAAGITLALENARRLQERTALRDISAVVSRAKDLNQILEVTVDTVRSFFPADACSLYLIDPDQQHVTRRHQKGLPSDLVERARTVKMGQCAAGRVAQSGTPIVAWDAVNDPRNDGMVTVNDNLSSLMAVPIKTDNGILGVLIVLTTTTRYFTQHDVEILEEIADHVGLAIERDRAHDQYRRLFQNARDPMFTVNLHGYIVDANQAAYEASGYQHPELIGTLLSDLVAKPCMVTRVRERLAQVANSEEVPPLEFAMRHKNQSTVPFESNLTAIRDHFGTITAIQAVWRNMTEHQRLAEVQIAATVLEQMGLVGGVLAHSVCGFLGAIGATADLLHSRIQSTDRVTTALLDNVRSHGRTADRLVAQLRGMRKAAHQDPKVISLKDTIETSLKQIDIPLHIKLNLGPLDLPEVYANRVLLSEILEGVFRNALDAMPKAGALSIRGSADYDQSTVWLHVSDTGPGMSPKVRENVFNPFFSTKTDAGGGLGLGLWLSRLYLQTLGGNIDVINTSPQGSTFVIELPMVQAKDARAAATSTIEEPARVLTWEETTSPQLTSLHVLVVEDETYWQGVLAPLLMLYGFHVQLAASAMEALNLLDQHDFAAFVVDIRLVTYDEENMDGLDVVEGIRARYPLAPVLILSVWEPALTAAQERFQHWRDLQILDKMNRAGLRRALDTLAVRLTQPLTDHN